VVFSFEKILLEFLYKKKSKEKFGVLSSLIAS